MPLITSTYQPSLPFRSSHLNTVYNTLFKRSKQDYTRERISTPDGDFIDMDLSEVKGDILVLALHGLEGSSQSPYIRSLVKAMNTKGISVAAFNGRGCSGTPNLKPYSYHSGKIDDVHLAMQYLLDTRNYNRIFIVGYSMGGNQTLRYLSSNYLLDDRIKGGVGISVPCDLQGSAMALNEFHNWIYLKWFMFSLKHKAEQKLNTFPHCAIDGRRLQKAKNFRDFDGAVTAPLFNYGSAEEYWQDNSSLNTLPELHRSCLLINALDDTFLSAQCYPVAIAQQSDRLSLEMPKYGGHVGFHGDQRLGKQGWLEHRIRAYLSAITDA